MIRIRIELVALITLTSCIERPSFKKIECEPEALSINSNLKRVFKPCREYIFSAKYWDEEYNLISDEKIWMMATGNDWEYQPDSQDEIVIQYDFDETKTDFIHGYNINPEMKREWVRKEVTGIIETKSETWMHPFRSNQYAFTEVVAFPSARAPLEAGNRWSSTLQVYEGWGKWSNSTINNNYGIIDYEIVTTEFKELRAWHIKGRTMTDFGNSVNDFWYNEEYGFIKMVIRNYEGQLLAIELISVK